MRVTSRRGRRAILRAAAFSSLPTLTGAAFAQAVPALPPQPTPAVPGRQQVAPPAPEAALPSTATIAPAPAPARTCPFTDADPHVTLTDVRFEPSGADQIEPEIAALLAGIKPAGTADAPLTVVCELRDRANAALEQAGYLASVQIPPQDVAGGVLRLQVTVSRISEVRVTGGSGAFRDQLDARLAAIKAMRPVNTRRAQQLLLAANDVPGLRVRMTLRPGAQSGDLIADVVVETQPALVVANVQNSGSHQLGRWIATARGEFYGLTGFADRTFIAYSNTLQWDETHLVQGGHDFAIGSGGVRLGGRASYAVSNPDFGTLDLRSRSLIAGLDLTVPLVRAVDQRAGLVGGFEILDQRTVLRSSGTAVPFTRDRLRALLARFEGDARGRDAAGAPLWAVSGAFEARRGLGILSATRRSLASGSGYQPSRFEGDPKATILRGTINSSLELLRPRRGAGLGFGIDASVFGQWSNHPLLNLEEFSLGNYTYGRGYDPGANGGDRVLAARAQPRLRRAFGDSSAAELFGFYEVVKIWNLDSGAVENRRRLRSWGGGARLSLFNRAIVDVTYAKPLDRALVIDAKRPSPLLLVSFTAKLFP